MKKTIKDLINEAFNMWLMDEYIEEIHDSDDLITASGNGDKLEEFIDQIREVL